MPDPKVDIGGTGFTAFPRDSYSFIFDFGQKHLRVPGGE